MSMHILLLLFLRICLDCGFAQVESFKHYFWGALVDKQGGRMQTWCEVWPDEPGSQVCSLSTQKVPERCWKPMSGLFNTENDHNECSKGKNGIKPNIFGKCTTVYNCGKYQIFHPDSGMIGLCCSPFHPSILLSFLKRKFALKPPMTRGKLTIQPHGPVDVALALCIHSLTTPGRPCPTGVLQSL